jgi:hypothetical protein
MKKDIDDMTPDERTESIIRSLDNYLSGYGDLTATQFLTTIRWINSNLDRQSFQEFMKELDIEHQNVLIYLLDRVELNPTRYN